MGILDETLDLPASGSLGLAPLPATAPSTTAPSVPTEAPVSATPQVAAPPATASLGFGSARPQDDAQFLASLPTHQKIGLALQAGAAAMNGQPSPIDTLLAHRRQSRLDAQNELSNTLKNVANAYDVLDKVPEGPQKDAMKEMLGRTMPAFAGVFAAHGSDTEAAIKARLGQMTPSAQKLIVDACSGVNSTSGRQACFLKVQLDDSFSKKLDEASIQDSLPGAIAKVQAAAKRITAGGDPTLVSDGKPRITTAQLIALNETAKKGGDTNALSDAELNAVLKRQASFSDFGLVTDETLRIRQEAEARNPAKETTTGFMKEAVALYGEGTPAYLDAIKKHVARQDAPSQVMLNMTGAPGATTHGIKSLTTAQNDALFGPSGAVTSGRLDPGKVNSRTASIFADAEIANPGTDFAKLSSDIQLGRNATFRQKAMTAEVLPEIMSNMVASGKKVDFSKFEPIGRMQAWALGKVNDPALTEYMSQRNDALMTIAGVMRSVNMSDYAHKAETEVASPTMSPDALDAWMRGQMKSLAPRLKNYQKYSKDNVGPTGSGGASFSTEAEATAAAAAGKIKKGDRITVGGQSGVWQ